MPMGAQGMAEMGSMEMAAPDNTLPMMTGFGQFGAIEMGGMFSVVKVRDGLPSTDYKDPGWFKHPPGTVAYEVKDAGDRRPEAPRAPGSSSGSNSEGAKFRAVKPGSKKGHGHH